MVLCRPGISRRIPLLIWKYKAEPGDRYVFIPPVLHPLVLKFQFLRACDTHVAAGDLAHNGAVPAMNKNATTWRIDFFLDTQGELSYSPSQKKELLITLSPTGISNLRKA